MLSPNASVNDFRRGHEAILAVIEQIRADIHSFRLARKQLSSLNDLLLAHWGRQDDAFFKKLTEVHSGNREIEKLLEFFIHDLKECKVQYLVFFDKYTGLSTSLDERTFPKDFNDFAGRMIEHIHTEEEYLIPILKKTTESES